MFKLMHLSPHIIIYILRPSTSGPKTANFNILGVLLHYLNQLAIKDHFCPT